MNQEERAVIDGIFERLKGVANQPRDPEAERYIAELVRTQPYAPYAMAQSVFVQEQALINQQQQIEQLQAQVEQLQAEAQRAQQPAPQQSGGFLSGLFGGGAAAQPAREAPAYGQRGREAAAPSPWGAPQQGMAPQGAPQAGPWGQQAQQPQQRQGMGFLGTAAAAAAGVAGGMMLGNVLSSAFGGSQAHAAQSGLGNLGLDNNKQAPQHGSDQAGGHQDEYDNDEADFDGGYDDGDDSYEA